MEHELTVAADAGMLGSIDANRGDTLIGWDTDQFPTDIYLTTQVMVAPNGRIHDWWLNFDAKRRRESHEEESINPLISAVWTPLRGLKIASAIRQDGRMADL